MNKYIRTIGQEIFHRDFDDFEQDTMKKEEILGILMSCGLSEYESKVYSSLVFLGPSKAGTISRESKVPQSKIYEILDQLMDKQLVEMFDGRPKEFRAAEPGTALKNLLDGRLEEIEELKLKVDEVKTFLKSDKESDILEGVWVIKGEKYKEFFNKTAEMLRRRENYVYAITCNFSRSSSMAEEVKKCVKRGVKIRVIGMESINSQNYYKAKWYLDNGIEVKIFETKIHPRIVVADGRELLLRLDYPPNKRNNFRFSSMWSQDPSLVAVMDNYVKNIWKNAKTVNLRKASWRPG